MKLVGRPRSRGAAYVEVLVIVGVVLVLGLLAISALGRSSSEQADKEAACIQSFSCGSGSGGGAGSQELGAVVGTPGDVGAGSNSSASSSSTGGMPVQPTRIDSPSDSAIDIAANRAGRVLLGMWDGARELVVGVGTLVFAATPPGQIYYQATNQSNPAADALLGLGKLAFYATPPGQIVTLVTGNDPIGDLGRGIADATTKAWREDPWRTSGRAAFEVVSVFGPGAAAKVGGGAATAAEIAKIAAAEKVAAATRAAEAIRAAELAETTRLANLASDAAKAREAAALRAAEAANAVPRVVSTGVFSTAGNTSTIYSATMNGERVLVKVPKITEAGQTAEGLLQEMSGRFPTVEHGGAAGGNRGIVEIEINGRIERGIAMGRIEGKALDAPGVVVEQSHVDSFRAAMDKLKADGKVFDDLHPGNVIIGNDGKVTIIDNATIPRPVDPGDSWVYDNRGNQLLKRLQTEAALPPITVPPLAEVVRSANVTDKGGLTAMGRAVQKHGSRPNSAYPAAKGSPATMNATGERIMREILDDPGTVVTRSRNSGRYGDIVDYRAPDGRGIRVHSNGDFIGVLEP